MGCGVSFSCGRHLKHLSTLRPSRGASSGLLIARRGRELCGIPSQPRGGIRSWPLAAHFCPRSLAAIFAGVGETRSAARRRQTGGGACVRVQAPTSVGGWDYLRICCPQVKFMSCAATFGCSERGSRQPHPGSRISFRSFGHVQRCPIGVRPSLNQSELYIENLGDRSSYISNTCMFCHGMPSRYWLQVLLRV
jgi:hypothetical protein